MIDDDLDMLMHFNNLQLQIDQNIFVNNKRRYMVQEDPFIELSDRLFIGTYRLCKKSTQELICTLTPYMIEPTTTARLSIKRKVLTALRFFASGSYQQDIGEHRGAAVSQSSICDSDLKILNVCAKFPGSAHDSHIWRLSQVQGVLEHLHSIGQTSYFLLGDSGYGLRPWIQIPLYNPEPNTPAERYNKWLCKTRSIIERCNGVLKMRFRCLLKHRVLHYHPEKAAVIINACTILHNICITNKVPIINNDNEVEAEDLDVIPEIVPINDRENRINPDLTAGRNFQQHLIQMYFT